MLDIEKHRCQGVKQYCHSFFILFFALRLQVIRYKNKKKEQKQQTIDEEQFVTTCTKNHLSILKGILLLNDILYKLLNYRFRQIALFCTA